jgi:hypothetical protein
MSRIPPALPPRLSGQSQTSPIQPSTVSESSSDDTFCYKKLEGDEFRLFLLPNRTGSRLYKLKHFDLYAAPPYLALSYSWGKKESNAELALNEKKFKLPKKNLEIALEYLINRYPGWYLCSPRNVCSSQSYVSREQRRLCSGSAQARLTFGSGLLRFAYPYYATWRS